MKDILLEFSLRKDDMRDVYVAQLVDGAWKVEDDFAYDFTNRRLARVLEGIENNYCTLDDLKDIGVNLWAGLMAGRIGKHFEAICKREIEGQVPETAGLRLLFRLELPPELAALPWETLYRERDFGFVACHPDHCIQRAPPKAIAVARNLPPIEGKLKILAVIPSGSGLNAEHEWHNLELSVGTLQDKIHLERLTGRVDPDRLSERLRSEHWDIVHFIGHGEHDGSGKSLVRLNSGDAGENEKWMEAEKFGNLFAGTRVRLALLNCCLGAKPSPLRGLSGLAPFLLRAGVPAVVAMRFEISDSVAIRFSDKFYQELLNGREPGRVDLAVEHARRSIFQTQGEDAARDFVTPILFLALGCEQLFHFELGEAPESQPPPIYLAEAALPAELEDALRQGLCVPVIGQRVLMPGAMRSASDVIDPRSLAEKLARKFSYPRPQDLELCDLAGDWMDLTIFQWICQYHVNHSRGAPYRLTQEIQNAYKASRPPALLLQIAEWPLPGAFYLFFDGLLEDAFGEQKKPIRVLNAIDAPVPPGSEPLLVHVRGTHKIADSLILTEQDHDKLWDRIGRMTPQVADLVRGHIGRSLVFLGVNPRDPLVKRLITKLLEQASHNSTGPVFFLCRPGEKGDPYWEELDFPVVWVEGDLQALGTAMTQALRTQS